MTGVRVLAVLVLLASCGAPAPPPPRPSQPRASADPLALDGATLTRTEPRLAGKVGSSPFTYFRYTNRLFANVVCGRYASVIPMMPLVHVHGDAHLEQYAVAMEGRGLADFDASGEGPPVIDLVRFATSLVLAWPNDEPAARAAVTALLRGYFRGLDDPSVTIAEPQAAARLRARFAPTRGAWLDRIQALILPAPSEDRRMYERGWADFVTQMHTQYPTLTASFFDVKVGGKLEMGIGSAHAEKFLARVEGPSLAPEDDVMIEAKALEPGAIASCMRGVDLDAARVIEGQTQMSNAPQRFLAAMKIRGRPFYTHAWLTHYTELSVSDIASPAELAEVAEDVGIQLGRGHAKSKDEARTPDLRRALRKAAETVGPDLDSVALVLAADVTRAWRGFRAGLSR